MSNHAAPTLAIAALLAFATPATAEARADPGLDVRVLIDVSGSMKRNDRANLRVPALRLLTGLLPDGAHAGVWIFGDRAVELLAPRRVDTAWKRAANAAAAKVHSRDQHTDIEAALLEATEDWTGASPPGRRELIVLTDGIVDVAAGSEESRASRGRLIEVQLPRLRQLKARVHTLALSPEADAGLMERLSAASGGYHEAVAHAGGIERAFLRIFEASATPDSLPIVENRFEVDASVTELTLVVFRAADSSPTRIIEPDGRALGWERLSEDVRWDHEDGFDLITVTGPAAGTWRIDADPDPANRALIITDLQLKVGKMPKLIEPGRPAAVSLELIDGGRLIDSPAILGRTTFGASLGGRPGASVKIAVAPTDVPGRFLASIPALTEEGIYELRVTASAPTFARDLRQVMTVGASAPDAADGSGAAPADGRDPVGQAQSGATTSRNASPAAGASGDGPVAVHADAVRPTKGDPHATTAAPPPPVTTAAVAANEERPGDQNDGVTQDPRADPAAGSADTPANLEGLKDIATVAGFNLLLAGIGFYFHRRWRNRPGVAPALEAL